MKVKRRKSKKTIVEHYQHVNNGGLTIRLVEEKEDDAKWLTLEIEDGYQGYSEHILRFHEIDRVELRKFSRLFEKMSQFIEREYIDV